MLCAAFPNVDRDTAALILQLCDGDLHAASENVAAAMAAEVGYGTAGSAKPKSSGPPRVLSIREAQEEAMAEAAVTSHWESECVFAVCAVLVFVCELFLLLFLFVLLLRFCVCTLRAV